MTVLKQYNTSTSTWDTVVVGQPGEPGIVTASTAPADTSVLWMDTADTASQVAIPSGGTTGQILAKTSGTDYATGWVNTHNRNYIINGGMDIWQRGTSLSLNSGGVAYSADRWLGYANGAAATYTQQAFTPGSAPVAGYEGTYFLRHTTSTGGYAYLEHKLEDARTFAGQTATFSFWAKAASAFTINLEVLQAFGTGGSGSPWVGAANQNFSLTTSWVRYSVVINFPSVAGKTITASNAINFIFSTATTGAFTFDIWGVQLEAGSVATPFKRNSPNIQAELAACQRYYWRISSATNPYVGLATGIGIGGTTPSVRRMNIPLPVSMRTKPSVSINGNHWLYDAALTNIGLLANIGANHSGNDRISLDINSTSSSTQHRPYMWIIDSNNANDYIEASAEL